MLVVVQLFRKGFRGRVTIIEPRERLGSGLAYFTPFDQHLLNVPAGKMSALAGQPGHFLEWLRAHQWPHADADSFAPRKLYGEYLHGLLQATISACGRDDFSHIRAEVVSLAVENGGVRLALGDGTAVHAEKAVLALGNPASGPEPHRSRHGMESRWQLSPWFGDALQVRFPGERILILGTGLTAVDSVLALQCQSTRCQVVMLSCRGALPQVHDLGVSSLKQPAFLKGGNLRLMVRELRSCIEAARQSGLSWRVVVDGLRPVSNEIWRGLSATDKARFFRHLKTHWEPHRHRMAPEIRARLDEYQANGALRIVAGRIQGIHSRGDASTVGTRLKHGGEQELKVNRIVSCTGIQEDYAGTPRPLIRSLIEHGLARANHLGIGFQTDEHGALLGDMKQPSKLFTLGPPRRGELFETTAVPEIRVQAEELARYLVGQTSGNPNQAGSSYPLTRLAGVYP